MIKIKSTKIFLGLMAKQAHPLLVEVLAWLDLKNIPITVTSFFRRSGSGVHSTYPVRAIDLRSRDMQDPQAIAELINENWTYDSARPHLKVALYHDAGSGFHFHIQVHNNTEFVGPTPEFETLIEAVARAI